ncbi:MAG: dihydropteroate synthase, partial [Chloroflexota bacterium]|nr:dihydropteroate synthase [Chloroflexota bacterium]
MLVIGERINASSKSVGQAIADRNEGFLANLATAQSDAGADFIDVNAGAGHDARENASATMEWLIGVVQAATDKPLTIDSDDPEVIRAALGGYRGDRVMINSVNAEPARLEAIAPLAAKRQASLIALVMGEGGIPATVAERLAAAELVMTHLTQAGVSEEQVYFDPLVIPISVDSAQALITLRTIQQLKDRYPAAKTVVGLSNISFGLPNRALVNRGFLLMAASAGVDAAILDPLDARMMSAARVADMLTGKDTGC